MNIFLHINFDIYIHITYTTHKHQKAISVHMQLGMHAELLYKIYIILGIDPIQLNQ